MSGALIAVIVIVVLVGAIVLSWYFKKRRMQEMATFAARQGLEYSPGDSTNALSLPFDLFGRGEGRGVESTASGALDGEPLRVLDYWYYTESSDSEGGTSRTYHRYSCAVLEIPVYLPDLEVRPEGFMSRLADHVGLRDLEFESEEFNRRFQVKAPVREFAYELLDARMIAYLLSLPRPLAFEVSGPYLLASSRRLRASQLPVLLGSTRSFRRRIPRMVWERYAAAGGEPVADRPDEP